MGAGPTASAPRPTATAAPCAQSVGFRTHIAAHCVVGPQLAHTCTASTPCAACTGLYCAPPPNPLLFSSIQSQSTQDAGPASKDLRARVEAQLAARHSAEKVLRCWGGSGTGTSYSDTKAAITSLLQVGMGG